MNIWLRREGEGIFYSSNPFESLPVNRIEIIFCSVNLDLISLAATGIAAGVFARFCDNEKLSSAREYREIFELLLVR